MELISLFIPSLWEFIVIIIWMHISVLVAYLLQWNPRFSILQLDAFSIYPWSCQYCMQFWVTLVPMLVLAYIWDGMFVLWGLIASGCLAYSVYKSLYKKSK